MQTTPEQWCEWLALLEAEQARRAQRVAQEANRGEEMRQRLIDKLDQMAQNLRASPNWVEPTEEERLAGLAELNRFFATRGYSVRMNEVDKLDDNPAA